MATEFHTADDLRAAVGTKLGPSAWVEIDQDRIDKFADATGDHQWIHVDPERAAEGPFGGPVAHGYLTLAMLPMLLSEVVSVSDAVMGVNYGTEKIRFTNAVPVGSRVRLHAKLAKTQRRGPSVIWTVGVQIEIEGKEKPALVGEVVYMAAGAPDA
jgi:acyl dehydratase